jgi:hypothetical protein
MSCTPPHSLDPNPRVIGTWAIGVGNGAIGTQIGGMVGVSVSVGVAVMVPVNEGVGVMVAVGTGVLVGTQPLEVQASQQLVKAVVQLCPPLGARHFDASFFTRHFVLPLAVVRQQVT